MIPTKSLIMKGKGKSRARCDKCGEIKRVRGMVKQQGEYICGNCKRHGNRSFDKISQMGKPLKTLKQCLDKVYTAKLYGRGKNGGNMCLCNFSIAMAERKFKIVLVDDNGKEINTKKILDRESHRC